MSHQPKGETPTPDAPATAEGAAPAGNGKSPIRLLGKQDILSQADTRYEIVIVPEWGDAAVRLRSLKTKEREAYEKSITVYGPDGQGRSNIIDARAKLLVRTIVDENGRPLFDDSDVGALSQKDASAIGRLFEVATRLTGLTKKDVDELAGNSSATQHAN